MRHLICVISLLLAPAALARDCDRPAPAPMLPMSMTAPGANDNHNNDADNLKHAAEAIVLTGVVYCLVKRCWQDREDTVIHFQGKQHAPE